MCVAQLLSTPYIIWRIRHSKIHTAIFCLSTSSPLLHVCLKPLIRRASSSWIREYAFLNQGLLCKKNQAGSYSRIPLCNGYPILMPPKVPEPPITICVWHSWSGYTWWGISFPAVNPFYSHWDLSVTPFSRDQGLQKHYRCRLHLFEQLLFRCVLFPVCSADRWIWNDWSKPRGRGSFINRSGACSWGCSATGADWNSCSSYISVERSQMQGALTTGSSRDILMWRPKEVEGYF